MLNNRKTWFSTQKTAPNNNKLLNLNLNLFIRVWNSVDKTYVMNLNSKTAKIKFKRIFSYG